MPVGALMGLPAAAEDRRSKVRRSKRLPHLRNPFLASIGAGALCLPRSAPRLLAQATVWGNQGSRHCFRWLHVALRFLPLTDE